MNYRLKLTVLTMIAGFATAFTGCSDDDDSDDGGGDAGEGPSATGGKASTGGSTSEGGSTASDGGSTDPGDAGAIGVGGDVSVGGATGDGGTPSEGGTPGEAGSPATGGTSTGGTGGGTCEAPACLEDLRANCAPEGVCTLGLNVDPTDPDPMLNIALCWDNGVKAGLTEYDATSGSATMQFQNANGTPCYVLAVQFDDAGNWTGEYRTVDGDVVATQTADAEANSNTVVCNGGETYVYEPGTCDDESPDAFDQDDCAAGTCTLE